ncbi:hypothetical protein DFQ26_000554 [Actinomortierella ambigua]|nr:hypothetical protein DFQ26_000554 [Actinomortierella ambigua]
MRKASSSAGSARGGSGKGGGSGIDDNCDSGNIGRSGPLKHVARASKAAKKTVSRDNLLDVIVKLNDTSGSTRHSIMEYILANYDTRHPNHITYFARTVRDAVSAKKPRIAYTNKNGSWIALARSRAAIAYKAAQALEKIDNRAVAMMTRAEAKTKARARARTRAPAKILAMRVTRNRGHSLK